MAKDLDHQALHRIFTEMAQRAKDSGKNYVPLHVTDLLDFLNYVQQLELDLDALKEKGTEPPNSDLAKDLCELVLKYNLLSPPTARG